VQTLPSKVHWKVKLELADLAKRENRFTEARQLYRYVAFALSVHVWLCHSRCCFSDDVTREVTASQPYAPQGWLEYSKMEEECGQLSHCRTILSEGLKYCKYNEVSSRFAVTR
jgi:hypothetical protein